MSGLAFIACRMSQNFFHKRTSFFVCFLELALDENMYLSSPCEGKTSKPGRIHGEQTSWLNWRKGAKILSDRWSWWDTGKSPERQGVSFQDLIQTIPSPECLCVVPRQQKNGARSWIAQFEQASFGDGTARSEASDSHSAGVVIFLGILFKQM